MLIVLQFSMWGLGLLALECQLMPGQRKRFDIYLVHWKVAVEVGGPQHFEGSNKG